MTEIFNSYMEVLMFTVIIPTYFIVFVYLLILKRKRVRTRRKKEEAFEMITDGFKNRTLEDKKDIFIIFKNHVSAIYNIPYADFLEDYIMYLRKSDSLIENFNDINARIKDIITEEQCDKPFEGVSEHEKRLLIAIDDSAKNNSITSIPHTLNELALVLKGNQKRLTKARNTNYWTTPLAIFGFILTIISWFLSDGLSQKDIDKIKINTEISIKEQLKIMTDSIGYDNK